MLLFLSANATSQKQTLPPTRSTVEETLHSAVFAMSQFHGQIFRNTNNRSTLRFLTQFQSTYVDMSHKQRLEMHFELFQIKCKCGLKFEKHEIDAHQVSMKSLSILISIFIQVFHCAHLLSLSELGMYSTAGPLSVLWTGNSIQSMQGTWRLLWHTNWALCSLQVQYNVKGKNCAPIPVWKPHPTWREEQQPSSWKPGRPTDLGDMVWSPRHSKLCTITGERSKE